MTNSFAPRLDVLPEPQQRLWRELGGIPAEFVLYRGTGVALHLGHRQSVDFDFFGNRPFGPMQLAASLSIWLQPRSRRSRPTRSAASWTAAVR